MNKKSIKSYPSNINKPHAWELHYTIPYHTNNTTYFIIYLPTNTYIHIQTYNHILHLSLSIVQ